MNNCALAKFIAFEGPGGAGKTTLSKAVFDELTKSGFKVGMIPEFSDNPIGNSLSRALCVEQDVLPDWIQGIGGTMAILSDKMFLLEAASKEHERLWIICSCH